MSEKLEKKWGICCNDMCFDGKYIWFAHAVVNLLFCVDIEKECVSKTYVIPYEECCRGIDLYKSIVAFEDCIWIIPAVADRIVIFDKRTETFDFIDTPHGDEWKDEHSFASAYKYNNFLYCIPGASLKLLRINMKTREQVCIKDFSEYGEEHNWYGYYTTKWKNTVIRSFVNGTDFMFIDLENEEIYQKKSAVDDISGYELDMVSIDDFLYTCSYRGTDQDLRKVDLKTGNIIKKVKIDSKSRIIRKVGAYIIVDYIEVPKYEIYDKEMNFVYAGEIEKDREIKFFVAMRYSENYWGVWKDFENGMAGCIHNEGNILCLYRTTDMKLQKKINLEVDSIYLEIAKNRIKKEPQVWRECSPYTVSELLNGKIKENSCLKSGQETIGEKIFSATM